MELVILPSMPAVKTERGTFILSNKFVTGMQSYVERWNGTVKTILDPVPNLGGMDNIEVDPADLNFGIEAIPFGTDAMYEAMRGAAIVLGGPHYKLTGMTERLHKMGVMVVPCVEYSLRTRLQILGVEEKNVFNRAKRAAWEIREETRMRHDISRADGVQCNGTPTFNNYSKINDNALLYFDTRTSESSFATDEDMKQRIQRLKTGKPLHLAYSGRLIEIKGAHHLLKIAGHLRTLSIPYRMTICGAGALSEGMRATLAASPIWLNDVTMPGVLDFKNELLPLMRSDVDLLISPHLQGDPSCTYLETMACGVPIIGYSNEAWAGIAAREDVGYTSPLGEPETLAQKIGGIHRNREELAHKSLNSLLFARRHSFETTADNRVKHLTNLVQSARRRAHHADGTGQSYKQHYEI